MEGLSLTPFFGIIVVIAAFFLIMFFTYKALYKKAPADAALVISGGKSKSVVFGGKIVNPLNKSNTTGFVEYHAAVGSTGWTGCLNHKRQPACRY